MKVPVIFFVAKNTQENFWSQDPSMFAYNLVLCLEKKLPVPFKITNFRLYK